MEARSDKVLKKRRPIECRAWRWHSRLARFRH